MNHDTLQNLQHIAKSRTRHLDQYKNSFTETDAKKIKARVSHRLPNMITKSAHYLPSIFGLALLIVSFHVSPTNSFSTTMPSRVSNNFNLMNIYSSSSSRFPPPITLFSGSQETNEKDEDIIITADDADMDGTLVDVGEILGTIASIVVLRSEFVLKTTGCGLPAGPFGIVGAIEGISYLVVVATCASAVVDYFSSDDDSDSSSPKKTATIARRVAVWLSLAAAIVGVAVLAFQLTDYGYVPNAVPMEGGMCE